MTGIKNQTVKEQETYFLRLVEDSKHSKKYTLHVLWFDCNFAPA